MGLKSGDMPGMGFLQMAVNGFGKDKGKGGGGGEGGFFSGTPGAAPSVFNTPPASPQPAFKQTPGFSQAIPLFGNMSDDDLAAYMAANGIRQPQGPASNRPAAATPPPVVQAANKQPKPWIGRN